MLVVGAGAAGWPAAIGAARQGARVLLLEEDPLPGGAAVDQFVSMPDGGPISGVPAEYLDALRTRFPLTSRPVDKWWYFWYMPADIVRVVAELVAAESAIVPVYGAKARRFTVDGTRVTGVLIDAPEGGERWLKAQVVIDATGTGALAEEAGCDVRYGEDAREDFGEAAAPEDRTESVQQCTWMFISQRLPGGDTEWVPRGLESGYRTPSSHTEAAVLRRGPGVFLHWGCRVDCRDTRDPHALADAQREGLVRMGPELDDVRAHGYGVHLAPRIGVREQRRVLGEHVVSAVDMIEGRIPDDSVLVTQRPIDIWRSGHGQMDYPDVRPYGIPYRALVPRGVEGLLVAGKHMSGTHLAMASYRVQSLLGQLGQAAGVAAALCAARNARPRDLDFSLLRPALVAPPQNLVVRADKDWVTPPSPQEGPL